MNQFRQQNNLSRHSCAEVLLLCEQEHCTVVLEHLPPREETLRVALSKIIKPEVNLQSPALPSQYQYKQRLEILPIRPWSK